MERKVVWEMEHQRKLMREWVEENEMKGRSPVDMPHCLMMELLALNNKTQ